MSSMFKRDLACSISLILLFTLFGCSNGGTSGNSQSSSLPESNVGYDNMIVKWQVGGTGAGSIWERDDGKQYKNFSDAQAQYEAEKKAGNRPNFSCIINADAFVAYVQDIRWSEYRNEVNYKGEELTMVDTKYENGLLQLKVEDTCSENSYYKRLGVAKILPPNYGTRKTNEHHPVITFVGEDGRTYNLLEKVSVCIYYSPEQGFLTPQDIVRLEQAKKAADEKNKNDPGKIVADSEIPQHIADAYKRVKYYYHDVHGYDIDEIYVVNERLNYPDLYVDDVIMYYCNIEKDGWGQKIFLGDDAKASESSLRLAS